MDLPLIWFLLIAVLWTGYFVLEGFDFGVGMLMPVLGRPRPGEGRDSTDKRRRLLLNTIGPIWDGNEVWVLTAGGATFAAFPHWYATLFSGFYLPLFLILVALILRNMGLEYRGKRDRPSWKSNWDRAITICSYLAPFLWGVALTNLVRGVPIDADMEYTGGFFNLLNPTALLGGLVFVTLFMTHGAFFIALKTDGPVRAEARALGTRVGVVTAVLAVVLLLVLGLNRGSGLSWVTTVVAALCLVGALLANLRDREGWAFLGTALTIGLAVVTYFAMLHPDVMPSSTDPAFSLTIENAASTEYTLKIMTVVAFIFTPVVLLYQGWTYWVFRKRIKVEQLPPAQDPGHKPVRTGPAS